MTRSHSRSPSSPVLRSVEDLVAAAQRGEADAVRDVLVAMAPTILATVRRIVGSRHSDVEDIAQDAAIHFVRALPSYRGECSIRHFVCRIATNRALAARRHESYREEWTPAADPQVLEGSAADEERAEGDAAAIASQRRRAVRALLDELPEPQAEAVALYFIVGLTAEEIAEASGAGVPAVRGRIRLAREALRARIEGNDVLRDMLRGTA